jgi:hypothetical protein
MAKTGSAYRAMQRAPGLPTEAVRRSPASFEYFSFQRARRSFPRSRMPNGGRSRDLPEARGCRSPGLGALRASLQDSDGRLPPRTPRFWTASPFGAVYFGKPKWWETEGSKLHYRFNWFRMSRRDPFAIGLRDNADWICISRDSLDALLKSLNPPTAKGESAAIRHPA